MIDKYTKDRKRIIDEKFYFEQAITITNKVHPKNTKIAILEYLKGNSQYFTNQQNARLGLNKYVHPSIVINLMRSKLSENNIQIPSNDNELVDKYLNILLSKQKDVVSYDLDELFNIVKNAYINTFNVYNYEQARVALKSLILTGDRKFFTNRFKDRDKIKEKLNGVDIKK